MAPDKYVASAANRMRELEGTPLASFGRRVLAFSIDFILVAMFFGLLEALAIRLWAMAGFSVDKSIYSSKFELSNWYTLLALVIYHGFLNYYWHAQTIGKRLMRIRVVSAAYDHLSLWHCIERALGYGASTLELGFGFFQYFIADNRQTTHDRIAGTIVAKVQKSVLPDDSSA